jgi:hypothetical protein
MAIAQPARGSGDHPLTLNARELCEELRDTHSLGCRNGGWTFGLF